MYYCTREGDVRGTLSITPYLIMFDPVVKDRCHCELFTAKGNQKALAIHFQACIDISDIVQCNLIELPGFASASGIDNTSKLYFLQLSLRCTGKEMQEFRDKVPRVNVYFRFSHINETGFPLTLLEQKAITDDLLKIIRIHMHNYSDEIQGRTSTMINYYDINRSFNQRVQQGLENSLNIPGLKSSHSMSEFYADEEDYKHNPDLTQQKETQQQVELFNPMPRLSDNSELLSAVMISQLVENLPLIVQLRNWKLVYNPTAHGTSLQTFMNSASFVGPTILVIKDSNGCIFGGYASEAWNYRKLYYGTAECFLFTFKETETIKVFFPTYKNEFYMMSDHESISMGGGGSGAGLFISGDLMKGYTRRSETYNNDILSVNESFNILNIEVWGLV